MSSESDVTYEVGEPGEDITDTFATWRQAVWAAVRDAYRVEVASATERGLEDQAVTIYVGIVPYEGEDEECSNCTGTVPPPEDPCDVCGYFAT